MLYIKIAFSISFFSEYLILNFCSSVFFSVFYLGEIELKLCEISMNRIHDHKAINYSDHAGLSAEFFLSERCSKVSFFLIF